jgi:hypothetical protein
MNDINTVFHGNAATATFPAWLTEWMRTYKVPHGLKVLKEQHIIILHNDTKSNHRAMDQRDRNGSALKKRACPA